MGICLNMIVRNEASGIVRTLESVRDQIDYWVIVDTGSTDGTQGLVEKYLGNLPGELHQEPFIDFATTRNRALDLAKGDWLLLVSGDDVLEGDGDLRDFLGPSPHAAHDMRIHFGALDFDQVRLVRKGSSWRYEGPTHETFDGPNLGPRPADLAIRSYGTSQGKRKRWLLDRELLVSQRAKEPHNPRWCFYLAQTYELLGELGAARNLYIERSTMGGFEEESWEALLRAGKLTPGVAGATLLSRAHREKPHRAEPLYHLAKLYQREPHIAPLLIAQQAASKTLPQQDRLFVDRSIYEGGAKKLVSQLC